jgi:hypothetical protein
LAAYDRPAGEAVATALGRGASLTSTLEPERLPNTIVSPCGQVSALE